MKKMKTGIGVMLALLCCILMCTGVVYATGDDTDGTELQVAQPVILEVQLGPQWAEGVCEAFRPLRSANCEGGH